MYSNRLRRLVLLDVLFEDNLSNTVPSLQSIDSWKVLIIQIVSASKSKSLAEPLGRLKIWARATFSIDNVDRFDKVPLKMLDTIPSTARLSL
jgi:hypothetical protein